MQSLALKGKSYRKVQQVTNIPFKTVVAIVKKHRLYDTFEIYTGRGRKLKTTPRDKEIILLIK